MTDFAADPDAAWDFSADLENRVIRFQCGFQTGITNMLDNAGNEVVSQDEEELRQVCCIVFRLGDGWLSHMLTEEVSA